ncbi:hypothetical protein DLM76_13965 [Leptospira yasudae]|nr:hypothetical protein DLM76_13965 [Leptospira yasudae]
MKAAKSKTRKPIQDRSIETKEKIVQSAYKLVIRTVIRKRESETLWKRRRFRSLLICVKTKSDRPFQKRPIR